MTDSTATVDAPLTSPADQLAAQMKNRIADFGGEIEAFAAEHSDDPAAARRIVAHALRSAADFRAASAADWQPASLGFDFDASLPAPDWIVTRAIERGTVVVLSGDTGAAKSILASSLIPAALQDGEWLGLRTNIERLTVIDEENPERLVQARLRALGTDNDTCQRFRYFSREGLTVGDGGRSDAWLRAHLDEFRPDLLIVDTLMAACAVEDTNSNSEAVRVMKVLRALARDFDCAVLLLHHERKQHKDYPSSSGQAMLGARQWAGQSDAHMTLTVKSDLIEDEAEDEGHKSLRRTFRWRPAEKDRDGRANKPQRVCVASEKDSQGRLLWMTVENEGDIEDAPSETDALATQIGATVQRGEGEMSTAAVAAAVGRDAQQPTFKRALTAAVEAGLVTKPSRGRYAAGSVQAGIDV